MISVKSIQRELPLPFSAPSGHRGRANVSGCPLQFQFWFGIVGTRYLRFRHGLCCQTKGTPSSFLPLVPLPSGAIVGGGALLSSPHDMTCCNRLLGYYSWQAARKGERLSVCNVRFNVLCTADLLVPVFFIPTTLPDLPVRAHSSLSLLAIIVLRTSYHDHLPAYVLLLMYLPLAGCYPRVLRPLLILPKVIHAP